MARPPSQHPTELELAILKVLWRDGPAPVRPVRDALAEAGRDLAYTSVMTVMNIMADKGYLRREKEGPSFVYYPLVQERPTLGRMLRDLVNRFGGSAAAAVLSLLETEEVDAGELEQIRDLVRRKADAARRGPAVGASEGEKSETKPEAKAPTPRATREKGKAGNRRKEKER